MAEGAPLRLRRLLLDRSVRRGEFVLASGQRSSYYIDCRLTTMSAEGQGLIGALGWQAIRDAGWRPRVVGDVETAGGRVLGVLAVVDREEGGRATLEREGRKVVALVRAGQLGLK